MTSSSEIAALADHADAYWQQFTVTEDDLDGFNHVNNAIYLKWLDATVWSHTRAVGLDEDTCMKMQRGMAAVRHEIDYLASAFLGDEIVVFNWIASNDGKLRSSRLFQMVRLKDQKTILRAKTDYVSTNLITGRPVRMPEIFRTTYRVTLPPR
jgi:acyl-CoA thioester hydrolase